MSILIATNCKNSERYYNTDSVLYHLLFLTAATDIGYRDRRFENIYDFPSSPDCFNSDFLL